MEIRRNQLLHAVERTQNAGIMSMPRRKIAGQHFTTRWPACEEGTQLQNQQEDGVLPFYIEQRILLALVIQTNLMSGNDDQPVVFTRAGTSSTYYKAVPDPSLFTATDRLVKAVAETQVIEVVPSSTLQSPMIQLAVLSRKGRGDCLFEAFSDTSLLLTCLWQMDGDCLELAFEAEYGDSHVDGRSILESLHHLQHIVTLMFSEIESLRLIELYKSRPADMQRIRRLNNVDPVKVAKTIPQCIGDLELEDPGALAVDAWDGQWTRGELRTASEKICQSLAMLETGSHIGILQERSAWTPVILLAILSMGFSFSLLDARLPPSRLRSQMSDSGTSSIIASTSLLNLASSMAERVIHMNDEGHLFVVKAGTQTCILPRKPHTPTCDDQAFVVYSSGSTGEPKRIAVNHGAWCSNYPSGSRTYGLDKHSRTLHQSSYSFIVALIEILGTLVAGGTVCIPSEDECRVDLNQSIQRLKPTFLVITPSVARIIAVSIKTSLRSVLLVGEPASRSLVNGFLRSGVKVLSGYGQTEACGQITSCPLDSSTDPRCIGNLSTGRLWIAHPSNPGIPTPYGGAGELLLESFSIADHRNTGPERGPGLLGSQVGWTASILGRTASGARWHRTGDIVRYDRIGRLAYQGRRDFQIKIRGQKVSLSEVELQAVNAVGDAIDEAVAVPVTCECKEHVKELILFVTAGRSPSQSPEARLELDEIDEGERVRQSLFEVLPSWMVPSEVIFVDSLPRTPTGKRNYTRLETIAREWRLHRIQSDSLSDRSDSSRDDHDNDLFRGIIQTTNELCCCILRSPKLEINPQTRLRDVGIDSISAMLLAQAGRPRGLLWNVETILSSRTFGDLARNVQLKPSKISDSSTLADDHKRLEYDADRSHVVTDFQRFSLDMSLSRHKALIYAFVIAIRGDVSATDLVDAIKSVIRDHDSLRLCFYKSEAGEWLQRVRPAEECSGLVTITSGRGLSSMLPSAIEFPAHFNIVTAKDDPMKADKLKIRLHHAVFDGYSMNILLDHLAHAYTATKPSIALYSQFIPYARKRLLQHTDTNKWFWRDLLAGSSPTLLRTPIRMLCDNEASVVDLETCRTVIIPQLPHAAEGVTFATVTKIAWAILVAQIAARSDITFLTILHGRLESVSTSGQIFGCCATEVPVRVNFDMATSTGLAAMTALQQQQLAASPHAHLGSGAIAATCTAWPQKENFYRHSTFFQFQNVEEKKHFVLGQDAYCDVQGSTPESGIYDFVVFVRPTRNILEVSVKSNSGFYSTAEVSRLIDGFCKLVVWLVEKPEVLLREAWRDLESELGLAWGCFAPGGR